MYRKPLSKEVTRDELMHMREEGWTNAEIAEMLDVSSRTIYNYIGGQRAHKRGEEQAAEKPSAASETTQTAAAPEAPPGLAQAAQTPCQTDWRDKLFADNTGNKWVVWSYIMTAGRCEREQYDFTATYDEAFAKAKQIMEDNAADFRKQTLMQDKGASDIMHAVCTARYHARKMMGIQIMGL